MPLPNTISSDQSQVVKYLKPSELLGLFSSYLSQQDVNRQVIFLQGIYLKNPKHDSRWQSRYDILRDEDTQTEITLQIPLRLADGLKDGNLVTVGGVLGRRVQNNSHIQLMLVVSRIEVVQEQAISEEEIKRMDLRRKKSSQGFKNVDSILEAMLYNDERPTVSLLFAQTSITDTDFESGLDAARSAIDFKERRVNFSSPSELSLTLQALDTQGYNVICIIRGGGSGLEKLDELEVLETIVGKQTPVIGAIGHPDEKVFIKQLVDKEIGTPSLLGTYFKDMVETVSEKKTKSRAALTEKIKKQFQEQLEAGQKQNKALQEKLTALTKIQEEANKKQTEAMGKLQGQLKEQTDLNAKQSKEFGESLKKMQETNGQLQKSLDKITTQNTESLKQLNAAKDRARELERQLQAAEKKGGGMRGWIIVAVLILLAFLYLIIGGQP